jgi:arylsulfatase A-like enzyme
MQQRQSHGLLRALGVTPDPTPTGLAVRLRDEAGYATAWVGKWHVVGPGPVQYGFEHGFGNLGGAINVRMTLTLSNP